MTDTQNPVLASFLGALRRRVSEARQTVSAATATAAPAASPSAPAPQAAPPSPPAQGGAAPHTLTTVEPHDRGAERSGVAVSFGRQVGGPLRDDFGAAGAMSFAEFTAWAQQRLLGEAS